MVKTAAYVFCLSSLSLLSACNLVLGIEEAQVDPRLVAVSEGGKPQLTQNQSPSGDAGSGNTRDDSGLSNQAEQRDGSVAEVDQTIAEPDAGDDVTALGSSGDAASTTMAPDMSEDTSDLEDTNEPDAPTLCDKYCEEITELCTGELEQYRDMRQCQTVCAMFPEGELASETNENTIACRLRYASKSRYAAGTEHAAYCRQAGPGGDGRCGSNCEGYCTLMEGVCTPEEAGIYRFEDNASCMQTCQDLPASSVPYSTSNVELSDGDHVQCRLFHVTSAAMLDAEEHCEHAVGLTLCEAS